MNSEIKSKAYYLRKKAEKLLANRKSTTISDTAENDILKLLNELEEYSEELEFKSKVLINSRHEIKDEAKKKYQLTEPHVLKLIHELEVNQIELDMQISELEFSQIISQDVAERYNDIFHFSSSGYFILSKDGEILDLNKSGAQMLGKERLSLKNNSFGFFVTDEQKTIFNDFLHKIFTAKTKTTCELLLMFENDLSIYVQLSGIITQNEQQCLITGIDITEKKRSEIYREMTREILHILISVDDLKDSIQQTLGILKYRIGLEAVGIRLHSGEDFPYLVHDGYSKEFLSTENSLIGINKNGKVSIDKHGNPKLVCTCGLVLSGKLNESNPNVTQGGSWWMNDTIPFLDSPSKDDHSFKPRNNCILNGYASSALVPIRINSFVVGLIQLNDKRKNRFNQHLIEILEGIAFHVGAVIMRKEDEELLRKKEELLRTITENNPDILLQLDRKGTILYINRENNGFNEKDCIGKNFSIWTLPEYHKVLTQSLERVFTENIAQSYLSEEENINGEIKRIRSTITPVNVNGEVISAVLVSRDITESVKSEEKLRENEQKLTEIYKSMSDGLAIHDIVYDEDGNVIDSIINEVNPAFERIIEVNKTEFIGKRVSETIIKRMNFFLEHYKNVELTGEPTYFDYYDEGLKKYLSFSVFTQGKGKFVTVIRNITFQKQAAEAILKSERKLSDIYNSMTEGLAIHKMLYNSSGNAIDYLIEEMNPAFEIITEFTRANVKGKKATEVYSVNVAPYLDIYAEVAKMGNPTNFETYFAPLNKYFSISVFSPEKGKFATVFRDITKRRLTEEALKVSESKFRNLVSDMHVGVLLQGLNSEIFLCNTKAQELLELTDDQLLGKSFFDQDWRMIHEDGSPFATDTLPVPQAIAIGKPIRNEVIGIYRKISDEWVWLLMDAIPQFDEKGLVNQAICTFIDITDRKKADEERKYLLYAVQNMDTIMTVKDLNLRVISGNNAFLKAIGHKTIQTAIGKTDAELWNVTPDTEPIHSYMEDERNAQKLNQGEYILREEPLILPNGEIRTLLTKKYPIYDDKGNLICTSNISTDITERKQMENALRESEQRLKYYFEYSPLAIVEWNSDYIVTQWSIEAERIFGWKKEETIGKQIETLNLVFEQDVKFVDDTMNRLSAGKEVLVVGTNRNVTKTGEVLVCNWFNSALTDENGKMTSVMSLVQNITNEKQAEELLRESEEKFSLVFEKSPYVIVLSSQTEGLVDVNEAFVNMFGLSKEEVIGKEIDDLGFNFDAQLMEKIISEMTMSGFIHNLESTFYTKSGEQKILRYNIDSIHSNNKYYTLTTAEDITARKQMDKALRESEYFFRESQKAAFIGSYKIDIKTSLWESSEVLNQIFGIDETYKRNLEGWINITHHDDKKMMKQYLSNEVLMKHVAFNKEYRIIRKDDGELRWVHGLGKVEVDSKNNVKSLVGTIQDITERKLKEETLRKLNQTLVALSKSSQVMSHTVDESEYLKQVCQIVVEDTDFPMVWIGYAQDDDAKTILPVASAGFKNDYLETIKLSWDDSKNGRGPTGTVIRTGKMNISNNTFTDSNFEPWRNHALKRGFASSSAFPLKSGDKAFGVMSIYSTKTEAFLDVEIQMLSELANDLAQGITTIRLRAAHHLAEKALSKSYSELEVLVKERTRELQITNDLLIKEINIRKQKEENLKLTEEKYRTVADFATNWEFWVGANNVMLYCSPSCERISGYSVDNFIQDSNLITTIIYPEDLELYLNHQKNELKAQVCDHEIQYRIIRKDGTVRWIGHFCQPIYSNSGLFNGTRGSNKDITIRKKMEELLKASNRKYNLLSENISDGIFILKNGHFEYINKSVCEIFGYSKAELEEKKLTEFIIPDQRKELDDFIDIVSATNQSCTFEVECFKSDSTNIYVEIILNYIPSEKLIYGVIHDITEKKVLQKSIAKAIIRTEEKERSHFSKELHDGLGPLLSTIKLYLQWSERPNANMSHTDIIKNAESILEEAITTVREISYKLSPHLLTNYGLNSAIKSFVDKIKLSSTINFIFESNYKKRLDIEIEATLYRAIIECVNNSVKYAKADNIIIKLEQIDNQLLMTYADDGVGFDITETLAKHKGLGLFNLQNRINTIGGKLNMISYPGSGVEFHILLDI